MNVEARIPYSASGLAPPAMLYCLNDLVADRIVEIWGSKPAPYREQLKAAKEIRAASLQTVASAEVLLCVDTERVADFLAGPLPAVVLEAGGIVALWSAKPEHAELRATFSARFVEKLMVGALLRDADFANSKVALLHEAIEEPSASLQLSLWSNSPLPAFQVGFFEGGAALPSQLAFSAQRRELGAADERSVSLANRLLEIEDRTLALRGEIRRLSQALSDQGGRQSSWFDAPRQRHDWPLAEPNPRTSSVSLYDARPDDAVIDQARQGAAFFSDYGLSGQAPAFGAAVDAINALTRRLRIDNETPDVSIIIPIYGQLPYTLNCIHSLFLHKSLYSVEIIIIDDCSPDRSTFDYIRRIVGIQYYRQAKNGGFIESCNTGARIAKGKYFVMLNNDTRVVDGWLDNFIRTFSLFPRAGLVGSKMIYPDGTLQEAGGILWRDGSAWNYGRNDDPNRPQYCYARRVDYVSGCSIALHAELWNELGGFDPHYAPAYAEDADLCQRIRARGQEVWLQPTSRVIHYEGKTSGTETSGGVKAYQLVNLRKLYLRWREDFASHRRSGEAPYFEKERDVLKRILFVDSVTPTPDQDAGSVQTMLGMQCSQIAGYKAHFVPEDNWLFDPKYTPLMQREGVECFYSPFATDFEGFISYYGWLFDVIVVYRISVMHKCLPLLRKYAPNAVVLFHLADLHHLRLQRQAELEQNANLAASAREMKRREFDAIVQSDCTITHSSVEMEIIAQEAPDANVVLWPLMMESVGTHAAFDDRRDICFLGGYGHPPNVDAVLYFVRDILPLIHVVRPELRFIVAGANPTSEIMELASDKIIVTGMVENLSDVFDVCRVFVCPLRVGAGAKGKVMSALAHGVPVVSTAIGAEGAGFVDGENILVADTPRAMAETILRLYDDPILWAKMSEAGLSQIEQDFSVAMGVQRLEEAVEKGHRKRLGLNRA